MHKRELKKKHPYFSKQDMHIFKTNKTGKKIPV